MTAKEHYGVAWLASGVQASVVIECDCHIAAVAPCYVSLQISFAQVTSSTALDACQNTVANQPAFGLGV